MKRSFEIAFYITCGMVTFASFVDKAETKIEDSTVNIVLAMLLFLVSSFLSFSCAINSLLKAIKKV